MTLPNHLDPPLVLLAPRITPDSVSIWKAALQLEWKVERLANWRVPSELSKLNGDVVVYAEPLFAEAVADQLDLILVEPPPEWLVEVPSRFRKRRVGLMTLAEAKQIPEPVFVKPAEGKVFEAKVYAAATQLPPSETVDENLPVLCSEPVKWQLEVRCFVRDRQLVELSPYWRTGTLAQAEDGTWPFHDGEEDTAREFAESLLKADDVSMPPAFVLDVGITEEHGWAVVEGNPCWGAGLYGCEPSRVLEVLRGAFKRRTQMRDEDWKWTSPRVKARRDEAGSRS
jgi:hypothetical protein